MEELSIEEKAKTYDEALERARIWKDKSGMPADKQGILDDIFPELAGSEDEQIRKELTKHLKEGVEGYMPAGDSSDYRRWLDWLEKQGKSSDQIHYWTEEEIEPIISDYLRGAEHYGGMIARLRCLKPESLEKQGKQKPQRMISAEAKEAMYDKPSDKVEPKFKVGDWVVYYRNDSSREVLQVYDIRDGRYYFTDNVHFSWSVKECDEKSHLWTIQDAKPGDVLACENGWTCIFKCLNDNLFSSYCFMDHEGWFCEDGGQGHTLDNRICGEIYPATNEQCDTLMKAMADAGYTFDFAKKELKKIEQKSVEWSEEDEKKFADACIMLDWYKGNNWWTAQYIKDWLKSLKDRYTWKPSDAQMASITCAVRKMKESACYDSELVSLLNDLKKLREE